MFIRNASQWALLTVLCLTLSNCGSNSKGYTGKDGDDPTGNTSASTNYGYDPYLSSSGGNSPIGLGNDIAAINAGKPIDFTPSQEAAINQTYGPNTMVDDLLQLLSQQTTNPDQFTQNLKKLLPLLMQQAMKSSEDMARMEQLFNQIAAEVAKIKKDTPKSGIFGILGKILTKVFTYVDAQVSAKLGMPAG